MYKVLYHYKGIYQRSLLNKKRCNLSVRNLWCPLIDMPRWLKGGGENE